MSPEIIAGLIAIVSGGSLTALIKVFLDYMKQKRITREKEVDDRIAVWQQLSNKNETRIEVLEKKVEDCDNYMKNLERYISTLEQTIVKADLELPERPVITSDDIR